MSVAAALEFMNNRGIEGARELRGLVCLRRLRRLEAGHL